MATVCYWNVPNNIAVRCWIRSSHFYRRSWIRNIYQYFCTAVRRDCGGISLRCWLAVSWWRELGQTTGTTNTPTWNSNVGYSSWKLCSVRTTLSKTCPSVWRGRRRTRGPVLCWRRGRSPWRLPSHIKKKGISLLPTIWQIMSSSPHWLHC